ncbi:MAG: helix-turn-helix domain-containing protein [Bdellovibrionaceae bacterium]|nr:helix-turn-helix domain-containing protein [Pseudobdellovibrionaceae bacterium]
MDSVFFIKALKQELRSSRVTYKDLSKTLKMTEAGVKKLLNKQDLSLKRANSICEAIGVSMYDIMKAAEEATMKDQRFSEEQTQFFLENPNYFNFYMQLAYEQKSPQEIQDKNLSQQSVFRYLKKLDDLKLIKLLPGNKVHFPDGKVGSVSTLGTPLEKIKHILTLKFVKKVSRSSNGMIFGGVFFLSEEENTSLLEELKEIQHKYTKRSLANRSLKKLNDKLKYSTITNMIAMSPTSLFEDIENL